jgi:hypothetical protein
MAQDPGYRVEISEFTMKGQGLKAQGLGFRVKGLELKF